MSPVTMRINLILICTAFFIFCGFVYSQSNLELVESIPVETTLDNPDIRNTQEVWLEMINSAEKSIDIEQFYISNEKGEPLDTILNALVEAAKRGVIIRIIIDNAMYRTYPNDVEWMEQQSSNIVKHVIDFKKLAGGIQHAKFFIIDDAEMFLGSQNFDWRALKHIHELGVRFKDAQTARIYKDIFDEDWKYCEIDDGESWSKPLYTISKPHFMLNSAMFGDSISVKTTISPMEYYHINGDNDLEEIIFMIQHAEKEVNLQFLSYNPNTKEGYWSEIDSVLINAAARGVKIKLLVSDWNLGNTAVAHFKSLISNSNFEVKYTAVPEWSGGYIPYARVEHCKFIVADSLCWIGTSNMSKDYFYNSRNVGLVVENGKFASRVRDIFYKSWNSEYAHPIEPNGEYTARKRD
jgi:phosphatidylserine/phosphatidylglycerophosphate/cardiolipin synthase-like enzyme